MILTRAQEAAMMARGVGANASARYSDDEELARRQSSSAIMSVAYDTANATHVRSLTDVRANMASSATAPADVGVPSASAGSMLLDEEATDPVVHGHCLCGELTFATYLSSIAGTFTCQCRVCCRASGSTQGVEWFHVPDFTVNELTSEDTAGGGSDPLSDPTSASSRPPQQDARPSASSSTSAVGLMIFPLRSHRTEATAVAGEWGVSTPPQPPSAVVFRCGRCGSLIGMHHGEGFAGCVLPKAALHSSCTLNF